MTFKATAAAADQHQHSYRLPALPVKYFPAHTSRLLAVTTGSCCATDESDDPVAPGVGLAPDSVVEQNGVPCPVCHVTVSGAGCRDRIAEHLLVEHKLVIAELGKVSCLACYFSYWRSRMEGNSLQTFCYTIMTNTSPSDQQPSEQYYLMSPRLPDDEMIRRHVHCQRLRRVLQQQARERHDVNFERCCLFCRDHISGSLYLYFDHLNEKHNFSVGRPQNLVFARELIDKLDKKLNSLHCIFCDGQFQERAILKEHMRKKGHKTLDPDNSEYDRYYVINYLEIGMSWRDLTSERDERNLLDEDDERNGDWGDWSCDSVMGMVCLFCSHCEQSYDRLVDHMRDQHHFCLPTVIESGRLSFYSQMRLVNFVRHRVHHCRCIECGDQLSSSAQLLQHMADQRHVQLPATSVWHQPHFLFPIFDNDALLHALVDQYDDDNDDESVNVVAESVSLPAASVLSDDCLVSQLKHTHVQ